MGVTIVVSLIAYRWNYMTGEKFTSTMHISQNGLDQEDAEQRFMQKHADLQGTNIWEITKVTLQSRPDK